ncbi:hypothetical protein L0Y69_02605 [bacterium]|nr:hypothetical protein [bacterium]
MLFWFAFFLIFSPQVLSAEDYTSTNFILRDPVFTDEGGYSTSASFQFTSATGQIDAGRGTSVSFIHCAGFLYFAESATEPCPDTTVTPPPGPSPSPSPSPGGGGGTGIAPVPYLPPDETPGICFRKGDLNDDCKVDLVDFSIAAYWYKKPLSERFLAIEEKKLNGDGKVTLRDFSIMAYYWTG